ncbi:HPP-domain-containing protein [Zopfia rhizophila CBS 207.26]|uniref:HPP-domain-containing protein n=1 Tax=Zopfia rhizophila CBS 207.26 TaxID=1314779 RepID=A0A6A6DMU1_9PEZI|nr:HPP-domain-containing protein [Zopfia rhizophila CBS 207.26]
MAFRAVESRLNVAAERRIQKTIALLPQWLSRFLGHRTAKPSPPPSYTVYLWGFVGSLCGLAIIQAVFGHSEYFTSRNAPPIVASFGASAILCYGAIDVPLAQPRSLIFGHFFSALTGVILAIIFDLHLDDDRDGVPRLQWLAASLATAVALVVMHFTRTTHPPAGATALLPCVDPGIWAMKWYILPVVLLSSVLVLVSALLVNNVQRQYPKFWIAPLPPPQPAPPPQVQGSSPPSSVLIAQPLPKSDSAGDLENGPQTQTQ